MANMACLHIISYRICGLNKNSFQQEQEVEAGRQARLYIATNHVHMNVVCAKPVTPLDLFSFTVTGIVTVGLRFSLARHLPGTGLLSNAQGCTKYPPLLLHIYILIELPNSRLDFKRRLNQGWRYLFFKKGREY